MRKVIRLWPHWFLLCYLENVIMELCIIVLYVLQWCWEYVHDALPSPKLGPRWALVSKIAELWGFQGTLPTLSITRGRGACWSSKMGLGRGTSFSYLFELEPASSQPNKLVSSHSGAPLVLGQATGNSGLIRLTMAQTWGEPPPSPF